MKHKYFLALIGSFFLSITTCETINKEYPPFNGWYNNRGNPSAGSVDSSFNRRLSPDYGDGVYTPSGEKRPNPRTISTTVFSGESGLPSVNAKTALFYYFSEHVMQEITDEEDPGCPPELFNVPVPIGDSIFDPNMLGTISMPYQRSRYQTSNSGYSPNHPREQLNGVTSYVDGSSIYGNDRAWSNQLRLFKKSCPHRTNNNLFAPTFGKTDCSGELISQADLGIVPDLNSRGLPLNNPVPPIDSTPKPATRMHQTGGRNVNENPFLLSIGVIWFRHHNYLARTLGAANPNWTDEQVFNEARIRNVATYQHILMNEWLPALLGNCSTNSSQSCSEISPPYSGYQSGTSVRVTEVFQAAAKHYIRTMTPPGVFTRTTYDKQSGRCVFNNNTANPLRTCNTYWVADEIFQKFSVDEIILGMASQIVEQEDHIINDDLINFFHGPMHFSRRDAVALIIQQGRDLGLPDYNTAREDLGLTRRITIREINPNLFARNESLLQSLNDLYEGNVDNMDVFVGGMLETENGQPGELFRLILLDQFVRLRDGDRFWFENTRNRMLTIEEIAEIRSLSFRDVILRTNPNFNQSVDISDEAFFFNSNVCKQPFQIGGSNHTWNTSCMPLKTYDYFSGSEVPYAISFAFFGVFVFLCILLMHLLAKLRYRSIQSAKKDAANRKKMSFRHSGVNLTVATEILGDKSTQQVQVNFGSANEIIVKNGRGNRKLRTINLENVQNVEIFTSSSSNILVFRCKKATYDLVLRFVDQDSYEEFRTNLNEFLRTNGIHNTSSEVGSERVILNEANTKDKRDKLLQKFFKEALAQSVQLERDEDLDSEIRLSRKQSVKLINTKISKEEFASYLKLKVDSLFVEQMFAVADADDDGSISFREFLDIIVLFSKGSPEDKLKLMFNMYDTNQCGEMSTEEFKIMLKSMMEMVNASIEAEHLEQLVADLMTSSGLGSKQSLRLEDFQKIMGRYSGDLSEARLVVPGQTAPTYSKPPAPSNSQQQPNPDLQVNGKFASNRKTGGQSQDNAVSRYRKRESTRFRRAQMSIRGFSESTDPSPLKRRHTKHVTNVHVVQKEYTKNSWKKFWIVVENLNEHYSTHIFCVTLYVCITIGVFLQAHNAVATNQPSGLARIGGGWMAVARASAAALMFNFSTLLLTMCRNTITLLRETFLHRFIPFDAAISMHKIIAWIALFFTALHVVAHGINFYSISTQSPPDLLCLFRDIWYPSDYLPSFVFWCYQTITGITGVLLTLNVIVMYVFACNFSRRAIFNWFQGTHKFGYVFMYFFSVLHGSGTLISSPRFYLFFLGPAILYTLDQLYSLSRKKAEISVVKAELLPSDVTHLEFKRPANFDYKAGQWVRIACLAQSPSEYHPFTLSSAPHEKTLKLHIRAVGPWTQNLRNIYDPETLRDAPYPKLYLDGPFGEGHQDWYKYEVSVLVGGGIGVTPFASILKDLVNTAQTGTNMTCQTVYFIWVTRDQKQYEWLMDIIQEVENKDKKMVLNTHIFITQFPQKFDLRTTMLYICEQHFQKIAGRSLFTGLRAITHFGRPDFLHFLASLAQEHNRVKNFGVFSCGPPAMTGSVEKACSNLNKYEGPTYNHHFENF